MEITYEQELTKIRSHHRPRELSGGQQPRVAIARALVGNPALLLADEPTGALDQASGKEVLRLFHRLHEMGNTIVMITHDLSVAQNAGRIVQIVDGRLQSLWSTRQRRKHAQKGSELLRNCSETVRKMTERCLTGFGKICMKL